LAEVGTRTKKRAAGAAKTDAEVKGKIIEFPGYMKKQRYAETTAECYIRILSILKKRGANLDDPESVKETISQQDCWSKGRKWNAIKDYALFLKL